MHTYTALFDDRQHAELAQNELTKLGVIPTEAMRLSGKDTQGFVADRSSDSRGFWDTLKDVFTSDDDRSVYEEGVRQGSWLLTVNVEDVHSQRVHDVLERSQLGFEGCKCVNDVDLALKLQVQFFEEGRHACFVQKTTRPDCPSAAFP